MLTRRNLVLPNAYLVREDDGFTLIDTTTRGAAEKLIAATARAGGRIRRVALTHGHGDHTGSLDPLKEKLKEEVEVLDARIHAGEQVVQGRCPEARPRSPHGPTLLSKTATWSEASRSSRALGTALDTSPSSTPRSVVDRRRCVHIN
jgi:glyoxylase-like metal-dependent hydrolase (beta-lactamase superfamily II)